MDILEVYLFSFRRMDSSPVMVLFWIALLFSGVPNILSSLNNYGTPYMWMTSLEIWLLQMINKDTLVYILWLFGLQVHLRISLIVELQHAKQWTLNSSLLHKCLWVSSSEFTNLAAFNYGTGQQVHGHGIYYIRTNLVQCTFLFWHILTFSLTPYTVVCHICD